MPNLVEPERCPKCGDLRLSNNWTAAEICDNCWNDEVDKLERRLAKKHKKLKERNSHGRSKQVG